MNEDIFGLFLQDTEAIINIETLSTLGFEVATNSEFLLLLFLLPSNNTNIPTSEIQTYNMITNEKVFDFLENPFAKLALFHERKKNDFKKFFHINRTAAQILFDAVYIEWYISNNPTFNNMKYRIYPLTAEWKAMSSAEERKDKLHEIAELLRVETREGAKQ